MATRGLRPKEVAAQLGLPRSTVYDFIRRGVIPAIKLGPRCIIIPEEELEEALRQRKAVPDRKPTDPTADSVHGGDRENWPVMPLRARRPDSASGVRTADGRPRRRQKLRSSPGARPPRGADGRLKPAGRRWPVGEARPGRSRYAGLLRAGKLRRRHRDKV